MDNFFYLFLKIALKPFLSESEFFSVKKSKQVIMRVKMRCCMVTVLLIVQQYITIPLLFGKNIVHIHWIRNTHINKHVILPKQELYIFVKYT